MPDCSVAAKSTASNAIYMQGGAGASLTADTLITPGGFSTTGSTTPTLTKPAEIGAAAPAIIDPYAATLTHTALTTGMPTTCAAAPGSGTTVYNTDTRFCPSGPGQPALLIKGNTVDLQPPASGHLTVWITDGDLQLGPGGGSSILECTTCDVTSGKGVTIILTTGYGVAPTPTTKIVGTVSMRSTSAKILSMNAPSSGNYPGVLIVQDAWGLPAGTTYTSGNSDFQGGPSVTFSGLVYFPKSNMSFQGNPTVGSHSCLIVVADTVSVVGNSSLATSGCASDGLGSTPTIKTIALAE
jgi:hypothetical protein